MSVEARRRRKSCLILNSVASFAAKLDSKIMETAFELVSHDGAEYEVPTGVDMLIRIAGDADVTTDEVIGITDACLRIAGILKRKLDLGFDAGQVFGNLVSSRREE